MEDVKTPRLFEYAAIKGTAHEVAAKNINPYLVDAPSVALPSRRQPIADAPQVGFGSKPTDGGHLLLTLEEKNALLLNSPDFGPYTREYLSADEFLNGPPRYCLWLKE